ncbi:uncharacterized protein LOC133534169 [Cydia pomonella]|uniref:uncharacterized protein LOC133534169 n=1 Tax=Cydia pomonella TaxID=82600 RepID=UPI002ADE7605|nr:uncharacterized protein LOC133534169 [Cydia pomonella]
MLIARLRHHLLPKISKSQYGFMPQRSTEDSLYDLMKHIRKNLSAKKIITLVSLDIEGAFDSAWWPVIKTRLAEENCPVNLRRVIDSYLEGRSVRVRYAGEEYRKQTSKGCVQGSIGGPLLWNLLLDPLLKQLHNSGVYCQAFADDVVMVFDGESAADIERQANGALERVKAWGIDNKLKFAPHKTCAMVVTNRLKYDTPRLSMGGIAIEMSEDMKILGLTVDNKLTFNKHTAGVCRKALNMYKKLARTAKIGWGLHPDIIRLIYVAVVEPTIMYAASAWAPAVNKLGIKKQINTVQRGFAQKISKAYRTVSLNAALLLAGILPLDLRIKEAASLYEARKGVPLPALAGMEVETMAPAIDAPHPADRPGLSYISLVDQESVDQHSAYDVRIFTDGSKIEGKVGAALSMWNSGTETKALKLALSKYCTVYQAELLAICKATEVILDHRASSFGVYSDSMAALETVTNHSCLHPLAVKSRDNMRTISLQNKVVTLFWIKAHAGLEGNERADQLAKAAAVGSKRRPDYDQCPISFVKRSIRMSTLDEWNRRYVEGSTASITKLFFPSALTAYRTVRKMETKGVTTQILTGHGGFSEYLNRFKCKDNPSCRCEDGVVESIPHILLECPVYGYDRFCIEGELEIKLTAENISGIMESEQREKFLKYCERVAKRTIESNKTRV